MDEASVKSSISKVEEVEEEGDSGYMNGASIPSTKTEEVEVEEVEEGEEVEKPFKETDVQVPDGKDDNYDDNLETPTAHVSQPEYSLDEVVDFLVGKGLNQRVAKSAARIIVEPISNTKKQLSLYGVNTGNLQDILEYLQEFKSSKDS
jgi:hypothetical protein